MMLAELCDQLLPLWKPSRQKDVKSAVRYLAKALDCPDPQHCSLELYNQPLLTLYRRIEDYQRAQSKSPHIIRNTKNVISRLLRLAAQRQLVSLAPVSLTPRYDVKHRPQRPGSSVIKHHGTSLPYAQWPPDLQEAFVAFQTWATAPVVPGRPVQFRKRLTTLEIYRSCFEGYFGYLYHRVQLSPTFDALFDLSLVTAYVHWHVNDCHHQSTATIHKFLLYLRALIRQYRPNDELCTKLLTLKKTLPVPPPHYDKTDAWVSRATLNDIARSIWPHKSPKDIPPDKTKQHPGLRFAGQAGISLMLRLWTYIPYRSRNMREMRLGDNLYKDADGNWCITFRSEQLKIATRRGRPNVFNLYFPKTLVPVLEEYLSVWHPILLAKAGQSDTHVFLTRYGTEYTHKTLNHTTSNIVYRYTRKHWHPHIIRTVWATEFIRGGGDPYKAAIMLNDKLETVIANYAHLRDENVAEEVYAILDQHNGQGK